LIEMGGEAQPLAFAVIGRERGDGVIEQVDRHSFDLIAIELENRKPALELDIEMDLGMRLLIKAEDLAKREIEVIRGRRDLRKAREIGELIHHLLELVRVLDDGLGALTQ